MLKLLRERRRERPPGQPRPRVISFAEMWTYQKARRRGKRRELWLWTAIVEEAEGEVDLLTQLLKYWNEDTLTRVITDFL